MEKRLTQAQLNQIIADVQEISQRQSSELSIEEVRGILTDLNMDPELLEEALVQLRRRDALQSRKKSKIWLIGTIAGISTFLLFGFIFFSQRQEQILDRVVTQQDRITFTEDDGGNLTTIPSSVGGELYYRVTLNNAPVGQKLSLSCNWIAPGGEIVHQNSYQTKQISSSIWHTYCRYTIGANSPKGIWKVEAFLGSPRSQSSRDRLLSESTFKVQ